MCHCLTFSPEILPGGAPGFPVGSPPTIPECVEGKRGGQNEKKWRAEGKR